MVSYGRSEKDFEGVNFELAAINIPKTYQGFGLGKKLFKHVTKQISKMGGRSFFLWCLKENKSALNFYENLSCTARGREPKMAWASVWFKILTTDKKSSKVCTLKFLNSYLYATTGWVLPHWKALKII